MFKRLFKPAAPSATTREAFIKENEESKEPWAIFEIAGIEDDGRIKVQFNWNSAFITAISEMGFEAETEDDAVQLFFYTSQMRPTELSPDLDEDDRADLPTLSGAGIRR